MVRNRPSDSLSNPPVGVSAELEPFAVIEFLHSTHQSDVALLNHVQNSHPPAQIFFGDTYHQSKITFDHTGFSGGAFGLDVLEIGLKICVHFRQLGIAGRLV